MAGNARWVTILFIFIFLCGRSHGQELDQKAVKEALEKKVYAIDTEAGAVVLAECKTVDITLQITGRQYVYTQTEHFYRAIKLLNAGGMAAASVQLVYVDDGVRNYIDHVQGRTYDLEDGKVQKTTLKKIDKYEKEVTGNLYETSFLLPNAKPGAVIEYSYDRVSPVNSLLPKWEIQGTYPKLLSTYKLSFPSRFEVTAIVHGAGQQKEVASEQEALTAIDGFCHTKDVVFDGSRRSSTFWVRKNIKAFKNEPFVNNPINHCENMIIQITGYPDYWGIKHFENNWDIVDHDLMALDLIRTAEGRNAFVDSLCDSLVKQVTNGDTIKAIYSYVRANFRRVNEASLTSLRSLDNICRSKKGNNSEINAVLCGMLTHLGFDATPLVLGTVGHVSPTAAFPVLERFNYIACAVRIDSSYMLLDASDKNNSYGSLPPGCYNGYARVVKKEGCGIMLSEKLLKERNVATVKLSAFTDTCATLEIIQKCGNVTSGILRKLWANDDKKRAHYLEQATNMMPSGIVITESHFDNLEDPDTALVIKYTGRFMLEPGAKTLYLNSVLLKTMTENPFKAVGRTMPIEFPCEAHTQYALTVLLPKDMEVTDLPAPTVEDIDSGALLFRKNYSYFPDMHMLTVTSNFSNSVEALPVQRYDEIRTFFRKMIEKNNEMITIKKVAAK